MAFKTADKVGDLFEKAIPARLRPMFDRLGDKISSTTVIVGAYGGFMLGKVLGRSGLYDGASIGRLQNPSGHGIDMFAKRSSGARTGHWDVSEIKTSGTSIGEQSQQSAGEWAELVFSERVAQIGQSRQVLAEHADRRTDV